MGPKIKEKNIMIMHTTAEHAQSYKRIFYPDSHKTFGLDTSPQQADLTYPSTLGQWGVITVTPSGTYGLKLVGVLKRFTARTSSVLCK
jgi:hypothetical protein